MFDVDPAMIADDRPMCDHCGKEATSVNWHGGEWWCEDCEDESIDYEPSDYEKFVPRGFDDTPPEVYEELYPYKS